MADEQPQDKPVIGKPFVKGEKPPVGKPFSKGDARINRNGRPKNFDMFRHLAQQMGNEVISSADGSISMTRVQMILRDWMTSKDPRKQLAFIEYAFGRVPIPTELTGKDGGPVKIKIEYGDDGTNSTPPEATP